MKLMKRGTNLVIAEHVIEANSFWSRAKGLLGQSGLPKNETLWIKHCNCIHTFFMKFSIDVLFVDKNLNVASVVTNVRPWRLASAFWSGESVFEFESPNPNLLQLRKGDALYVGD